MISTVMSVHLLNPIEQVFAKLKGFVRKAAPRMLNAFSDAIAQALTTVPPGECAYLAGARGSCVRLDPECSRRTRSSNPFGLLFVACKRAAG
jgi:hypothetical protein